jgi:hypothetical protein
MDEQTALNLAKVTLKALATHAKELKGQLSEDMIQRLEKEHGGIHLAAINSLASLPDVVDDVRETFCRLRPQIDKAIDGFGFFARWLYPGAVALLKAFKMVIDEIAGPLCKSSFNQ